MCIHPVVRPKALAIDLQWVGWNGLKRGWTPGITELKVAVPFASVPFRKADQSDRWAQKSTAKCASVTCFLFNCETCDIIFIMSTHFAGGGTSPLHVTSSPHPGRTPQHSSEVDGNESQKPRIWGKDSQIWTSLFSDWLGLGLTSRKHYDPCINGSYQTWTAVAKVLPPPVSRHANGDARLYFSL